MKFPEKFLFLFFGIMDVFSGWCLSAEDKAGRGLEFRSFMPISRFFRNFKQANGVPECHLYRALEAPPEKGLCFCLLISCPEVEFVSW